MEAKDTCGAESSSKKKKMKKSKQNDKRILPNILVTGTPGTGKTSLCRKLQEKRSNLKCINIGEFAKANNCLGKYRCNILGMKTFFSKLLVTPYMTYICTSASAKPLLKSSHSPKLHKLQQLFKSKSLKILSNHGVFMLKNFDLTHFFNKQVY